MSRLLELVPGREIPVPSGGEAALLADLAAAVAADHGVPPGPVFAAGLSAGGADGRASHRADAPPRSLRQARAVHSEPRARIGKRRWFGLRLRCGRIPAAPGPESAERAPRDQYFHGVTPTAPSRPVNAGRIAGPLVMPKPGQERPQPAATTSWQARKSGRAIRWKVWRIEGGRPCLVGWPITAVKHGPQRTGTPRQKWVRLPSSSGVGPPPHAPPGGTRTRRGGISKGRRRMPPSCVAAGQSREEGRPWATHTLSCGPATTCWRIETADRAVP